MGGLYAYIYMGYSAVSACIHCQTHACTKALMYMQKYCICTYKLCRGTCTIDIDFVLNTLTIHQEYPCHCNHRKVGKHIGSATVSGGREGMQL